MIDNVVHKYEKDVGPLNGARVVARAWIDADYKRRLLEDGTAAIAELGFGGRARQRESSFWKIRQRVHHVVVCTLCSCYPVVRYSVCRPSWYKSYAYRVHGSSANPGPFYGNSICDLPDSVEIRVWDSNSDLRYMVLPERPANTEDHNEEQLVALVTRDSMIGVAKIEAPAK